MKPYFEVIFGNPASQLHQKGWEAKSAAEEARKKVADLIGADLSEVTFTAGATESNNWALKGLVDSLIEKDSLRAEPFHVLTSNIEHASVREPLLYLRKKGLIQVDFLPVNKQGFLNLETIKKFRKPGTKLISLIWVHNEIGTIQNIQEIALWAQQNGIIFHSDATQAVGKIEVNVQETPISMLSFSAHKLYGPKGVGALYVHKSVGPISPLLHGGGQESTGRSGTLNVPAIVGFGTACELARIEQKIDWQRMQSLMAEFWTQLKSDFPGVELNGPPIGLRAAHNLNITLPGIQGADLLPLIQPICVSGGSACSSGHLQGNPVLLALGHNPEDSSVSIRISAGRMTTQEDFRQAQQVLSDALNALSFNQRNPSSQCERTVII